MTGPIPGSPGNCINLKEINLRRNKLTGTCRIHTILLPENLHSKILLTRTFTGTGSSKKILNRRLPSCYILFDGDSDVDGSSSPRAQLGVKLRTYTHIIKNIHYNTARARDPNAHGWWGYSIALGCIMPVPSMLRARSITRVHFSLEFLLCQFFWQGKFLHHSGIVFKWRNLGLTITNSLVGVWSAWSGDPSEHLF